ncbi:hypothetical protein C8R47DRAFT_1199691 [Mycena vitilis]|nr:hypothetical protein C8R47DRAFT_1199691 [Mycena vitilis]
MQSIDGDYLDIATEVWLLCFSFCGFAELRELVVNSLFPKFSTLDAWMRPVLIPVAQETQKMSHVCGAIVNTRNHTKLACSPHVTSVRVFQLYNRDEFTEGSDCYISLARDKWLRTLLALGLRGYGRRPPGNFVHLGMLEELSLSDAESSVTSLTRRTWALTHSRQEILRLELMVQTPFIGTSSERISSAVQDGFHLDDLWLVNDSVIRWAVESFRHVVAEPATRFMTNFRAYTIIMTAMFLDSNRSSSTIIIDYPHTELFCRRLLPQTWTSAAHDEQAAPYNRRLPPPRLTNIAVRVRIICAILTANESPQHPKTYTPFYLLSQKQDHRPCYIPFGFLARRRLLSWVGPRLRSGEFQILKVGPKWEPVHIAKGSAHAYNTPANAVQG